MARNVSSMLRAALLPRAPICCSLATALLCGGWSAEGAGEPSMSEVLRELRALRRDNAEMRKKMTALEKTQSKSTPAPAEKAEEPSVKTGAKPQAEAALGKFKDIKDASRFFAVPDSPAAAVLGSAPEKIIHAQTSKQLIGAAINGLDSHGHFQTGFAVDFSPGQIYWNKDSKLGQSYDVKDRTGLFRDSPTLFGRTLLNRTQLSFAAIRGTETEDKSSKLALGLNLALLDANDVTMRDAPDDIDPDLKDWTTALNRRFKRDTNAFENTIFAPLGNTLYEHLSWSVGGALTWVAPPDHENDYEYAGATVWSTMDFTFDSKREWPLQGLFHVRYDDSMEIPGTDTISPPTPGMDAKTGMVIPAEAFVEQDTLLAVWGLRFGSLDFNATASAAYVKRWQRSGGTGSEESFLYSVSAEKRIGRGPMWITLSAGKELGGERDGDTILLGGVRLGFDRKDFKTDDRLSRGR